VIDSTGGSGDSTGGSGDSTCGSGDSTGGSTGGSGGCVLTNVTDYSTDETDLSCPVSLPCNVRCVSARTADVQLYLQVVIAHVFTQIGFKCGP
jgi:hypothetical protein